MFVYNNTLKYASLFLKKTISRNLLNKYKIMSQSLFIKLFTNMRHNEMTLACFFLLNARASLNMLTQNTN